MNKVVIFVALFAAAFAAKDLTIKWADCGGASARGHITNLTWSPAQPTTGMNFTIVVSANITGAPVTDGKMTISAADGLVKDTFDICTGGQLVAPLGMAKVEITGMPCPIQPGAQTVQEYIWLSNFAPAGAEQSTASATDENDAVLFCVAVTMTIA